MERILVVDADVALCESIGLLLSSYGVTVRGCQSPDEARRLLDELDACAYLVQATGDGAALCSDLRHRGPAVVLLMGPPLDEGDAASLVRMAGADGYVAKPFEAMAVLRRLRELGKDR